MKLLIWLYGLVLALVPVYLIRFNILNLPTTFLEVMVGLVLLGTVCLAWNKPGWEKIKSLKKTNLGIGIFLAGAVISTAISPEPIRALGQLKAFFIEPVLLFYASFFIFQNKKDLTVPLKILFASVTLISLFGIIQYYTNLFLPLRFWGNGEEVKRITSVFEYPNALALYLAPLFILFLTLLVKDWLIVKKPKMIFGLAVMAAAIVLTYSRGAWIAVLAGVFILLLRQSGVSLKKWGSVLAIVLVVISPILFTRFKLTFNDASSSERLGLYHAASQSIVDRPLLGSGLYGFRSVLENSNYTGEILNYPHNIILNFWTETGLVGLIGFALIVWCATQKYKFKPTDLRFAAGLYLLVMLAHGMVDAPYFKNDLSILFWFVMALFYIED